MQWADVKALILVTLFFPSWAFIPEQMYFSGENTFRIPPSMALFLWAGASFIIAAPIIFLSNVARGDVSTAPDFKMAWHATKKPVSRIKAGPSWILTEVAGTEDEPRVVNRILPSNPSSSGSLQEELERLESMGVEEAWVATKHPFLVYLFFALFPLLLLEIHGISSQMKSSRVITVTLSLLNRESTLDDIQSTLSLV